MSWQKMKESPVFIGGHRKCGTTLLVSLLDHHPGLFVYPGETGFFYKFYPLYDGGKCSAHEKEARIQGSLLKDLDGIVREWIGEKNCPGYAWDHLVSAFQNALPKERETKDYFNAVVQAGWEVLKGSQKTARYWVEKTTSIEIYADTLFQWYPKAKFIHVLRDPRDNYGAIKAGWEKNYRHQFDSFERLLQSVIDRGRLGMELAEYNLERFGDEQYLIVRYEDVVEKTESALKRIAKFLNIPFQKILLQPTFNGVPWEGNNYENDSFNSVSRKNLNRWKERITEQEAKVLEFYFREQMSKYDYPLSFSPQEAADAAREHYKWFNYAQTYSLKAPKSPIS